MGRTSSPLNWKNNVADEDLLLNFNLVGGDRNLDPLGFLFSSEICGIVIFLSLYLVVFVDSCGVLISLSSLNIRIDKVGWRGGEVVRCVANGRDVLIWESGGSQDYTVGLYSMIYAVYV